MNTMVSDASGESGRMDGRSGALGRRAFLRGATALAAAGVAAGCDKPQPRCGAKREEEVFFPEVVLPPRVDEKMAKSEQLAHDACAAMNIPCPEGLLASPPVLQVPAAGSMGVAFAVSDFSLGFAEVSEKPDLSGAVRFRTEGMPFAKISSVAHTIRMTGLKPATKYYYRVGAAKIGHPVGYWMKHSEIRWGEIHSFTTPGERGASRFCFFTDTHGVWDAFTPVIEKMKAIGAPVNVWGGDCARSLINTEKEAVDVFLRPQIPDPAYAADTPILFVTGNHDWRGTWNRTRQSDILMPRLLSERCVECEPLRRNFAIRQGDIAMIGLDTGEDKPDFHPAHADCSSFAPYLKLQREWLKAQLRRPEIAKAPYLVAFCHIPLFDPNPASNGGDSLVNYAHWSREGARLWRPVLEHYGVQAVISGHVHRYRSDPPTADRPWLQITGGGPELKSKDRFPTVIEGEGLADGLHLRVHNVVTGGIVAEHVLKPRG